MYCLQFMIENASLSAHAQVLCDMVADFVRKILASAKLPHSFILLILNYLGQVFMKSLRCCRHVSTSLLAKKEESKRK